MLEGRDFGASLRVRATSGVLWAHAFTLVAAQLFAVGCCQPRQKSAELQLDVDLAADCPTGQAAEDQLRAAYGSKFGSVDGKPTASVVAGGQRCCYTVSYTLDQSSTTSEECVVESAPDADPTAVPPCPTGQDAVTQLTKLVQENNATGTVSNVAIQEGPTVTYSLEPHKSCSYPGTLLDDTDVCG